MKITTTLTVLLLLCFKSYGQSPSKALTTDWLSVYYHQDIQQKNVINIKRLGADPTGKTASDKYVQMALNNSKQTGAIVYFPKGEYLLNEPIKLSSNQYLAGDGSDQTTLRFDLSGTNHLISAVGQTFAGWTNITSETKMHERVIVCDNEYLEAGDLVRIKVADNGRITSSWATGSIGQICEVKSISKTKITLKNDLRLDLTKDDKPQLIKILPQENVGVVNLRIVRNDVTAGQTDNIRFQYTKNALVSGVHSDSCNFAHVNNMFSYGNKVEGSYFTNAFNYGNGGKAYGVVLSYTTSECRVENNIFRKLRHSVLFQAGSNGNIIGYNYSHEAYWTGVFSPSDFAGDIVMHGNYPFFNLIEGNIVQNVVIDNSHGINGPGNTFLRNRMENAGLFMNCSPATDDQIFIGNEITGTGTSSNGFIKFPRGLYSLCGTGHYQYGNNHLGKMIPEAINTLVESYAYKKKPDFLSEASFASIGYPAEPKSGTNDAFGRRENEVKTIFHPFEVPLGVRFNSIAAKHDEDRVVIEWSTNTIQDCEDFELYRIGEDASMKIINRIDCRNATQTKFRYNDYNFDPTAKKASYSVICVDVFGEEVKSDVINVAIQDDHSGISSNGRGEVYFKQQANRLRIYSIQGRLIFDQAVSGYAYTLPESVSNGVYVVQADYTDGQASKEQVGIFR
ncbi:MAG: hypothetical protein JJ975_11990 [Bacteroidia bacterium]|nr:hypothetical protein [Bacteroidia bacterium]